MIVAILSIICVLLLGYIFILKAKIARGTKSSNRSISVSILAYFVCILLKTYFSGTSSSARPLIWESASEHNIRSILETHSYATSLGD